MGRIFTRAPHPKQPGTRAVYKDPQQRLVFQQYKLTTGSDFRDETWFNGPDGAVLMAAYIGIGYAGYNPSVHPTQLLSTFGNRFSHQIYSPPTLTCTTKSNLTA